jgi:hypothetical protein
LGWPNNNRAEQKRYKNIQGLLINISPNSDILAQASMLPETPPSSKLTLPSIYATHPIELISSERRKQFGCKLTLSG